MCFLFLSTEASFCLNVALSWTISTAMLAAGHSDLAVTLFGVLLSWRWSCVSCLGNMRRGSWEPHKCHVVMYRRNRLGEQEVLAKKKTDRAPLVLGMPCCIKSCLCMPMQTYTCTLVQMCMQPCIQIHGNLPTFMLVEVGMHAVITNKTCTDITGVNKLFLLYPLFLPPPPPHFCHTFPSLGHCHVLGPTEHGGFKQERQRLSVRLPSPQRHMPSPAHVTNCLEVPVEVHSKMPRFKGKFKR